MAGRASVRQQGRIDGWQDERGFGFIIPDRGGQRVFLHISSFSRRPRRPKTGEDVTYILRRDAKGRLQAAQVRFAKGEGASVDQMLALAVAVASLIGVGGLVITGRLPPWALLLYLTASIVPARRASRRRSGGWSF